MQNLRSLIWLFIGTAFLPACTRENFNFIEEEVIAEPTIVETDDGVLELSLANFSTETTVAYGKVLEDIVYVVSNGEIICNSDGSVSTAGGNFSMTFFRGADNSIVVSALTYSSVIDGEESSLIADGTVFQCGNEAPKVNITELTEDRLVGDFSAFFYRSIRFEGEETDCMDLFVSVGQLEGSFEVSLEPCN
ncbi:MAG: hypothetical protein AAGG68_09020 [Bacteroidota bacterium]